MMPYPIDRRQFLGTAAAGMLATTALAEESRPRRKFTMCLSCGAIGVSADPRKAIELAHRFGFESVEPSPGFLASLSDAQLADLQAEMKAKKLVWGAAGLSVEFRGSEDEFDKGMAALPASAKAMARAGVDRIATWLSPSHRSLTYVQNFRQHARRLRGVAKVLGEHGIRLGLEYVGPKTLWTSSRFPFLHTMAEMKDLIAEIACDNVGFLLDTWHWYTAQETEADLLTLKAKDVVLCHVNDAPKGIDVEEQIDSRRELPCATGVINVKTFFGAMAKIGYDGPLVCEPFSPELGKMPAEKAVETVAVAVRKAFAAAE
jgi:sugar phosphate isomerase/epimerase